MEIVERVVELFTGGHGVAAQVFDFLDPEIEIHDFPGAPDRKWFRGHEGVVEFAVNWWNVVEDVAIATSDFVEAPDDGRLVFRRAVAFTGKRSGIRVANTAYSLFTFRDGKVLRGDYFATKAEALEAAGLSE